jgi:hypothetical protein
MSEEKNIFNKKVNNKVLSSTPVQFLFGIVLGVMILFVLIFYLDKINQKGKEENNLPQTGVGTSTIEEKQMLATKDTIPTFSNDTKVVVVGKESLYGGDINYYAYIKQKSLDQLDRDTVMNDLVTNSILLQQGEKEGWFPLTDDMFNNPNKNYDIRAEKLSLARRHFEQEIKASINLEVIDLEYFNRGISDQSNLTEDEIEVRRKTAEQKIYEVYSLVKNGSTMEKASEVITSDTSLESISPYYAVNTYGVVEYKLDTEGQELDTNFVSQFVKNAQVGDISEIQNQKNGNIRYFLFYKLQSKRNSFSTVTDWINSFKTDYTIDYMI